MTQADRPQSDPKIDSKVTPDPIFESLLSHFWVTWGRSGVGPWESLLSHFWITLILFLGFCRLRSTPTSRRFRPANGYRQSNFEVPQANHIRNEELSWFSSPGVYPATIWRSEEDKRATTNVQNRFVQFFLLSFLLFYYPWAKTPCFEGKSPGGKIMKKCQKVRKCEKLWNDFAL